MRWSRRSVYIRSILFKEKNRNVWRKFNIDKYDLRRLCKLYGKNLKDMKKTNRKFLNKLRKIESNLLEIITQFWQEGRFNNYTLNDLNLYLQKQTEGEQRILNSTLDRALKSKICMKYKKVNKTHPKILTNEEKEKCKKCWYCSWDSYRSRLRWFIMTNLSLPVTKAATMVGQKEDKVVTLNAFLKNLKLPLWLYFQRWKFME